MSDRELLENAARAAGIRLFVWGSKGAENFTVKNGDGSPGNRWNPLTDDGDALRLAVKLGMSVKVYDMTGMTMAYPMGANADYGADEPHEDDPYAATRRAIVRAASSIGGELT